MRRYLLSLVALTAAVAVATLLLLPSLPVGATLLLAGYFCIVTALQHWIVTRSMLKDARRFVQNEKQELHDKIEKLRNDLNLWENNLGFFASSKQADLLKQEFEKKMQGARQQIALLQAKLRILNETEKAEKEKAESQQGTEA